MEQINKNKKQPRQLQNKILLMTIVLFAFSFNPANAQDQGTTCDDPMIISSLPFNDSGNTADYGNNYTNNDVAEEDPDGIFDGTGSTDYLDGYDAVYSYTLQLTRL